MKIILFVFTGSVGFLTEIAIIQIAVSVFGASHAIRKEKKIC